MRLISSYECSFHVWGNSIGFILSYKLNQEPWGNIWNVFLTISNFQYQFSIISIIIAAHILIFRSPSSSSLSASLHSTTAACLCSHVASGSARRCSRLWDAGGVCHHGYRDCARAFELQSEGPTHSGASSKGKRLGCRMGKINMRQDDDGSPIL